MQYKSDGSAVWHEVKRVAEPPCVVEDLKEGVSYVFRVVAVNAAGQSDFSEESEPIKVYYFLLPAKWLRPPRA